MCYKVPFLQCPIHSSRKVCKDHGQPKVSSQVGQPAGEILRTTSHAEQSSILDKRPLGFSSHTQRSYWTTFLMGSTSHTEQLYWTSSLMDSPPHTEECQWTSSFADSPPYTVQLYWRTSLMDSTSHTEQLILDKKPYGFKITIIITEPNHA